MWKFPRKRNSVKEKCVPFSNRCFEAILFKWICRTYLSLAEILRPRLITILLFVEFTFYYIGLKHAYVKLNDGFVSFSITLIRIKTYLQYNPSNVQLSNTIWQFSDILPTPWYFHGEGNCTKPSFRKYPFGILKILSKKS